MGLLKMTDKDKGPFVNFRKEHLHYDFVGTPLKDIQATIREKTNWRIVKINKENEEIVIEPRNPYDIKKHLPEFYNYFDKLSTLKIDLIDVLYSHTNYMKEDCKEAHYRDQYCQFCDIIISLIKKYFPGDLK
jgi:hypothetical protein